MKKLITLLLIFISLKGISQTTEAVNAQIDVKIAKDVPVLITKQMQLAFAYADTITYLKTTRAGSFNFDTLSVPNNSSKQFEFVLTGYSTSNKVSCLKEVWISNTNGVYTVDRNLSVASFAGLTSGNFDVIKSGSIVVARITGTTAVINWTLKKQ